MTIGWWANVTSLDPLRVVRSGQTPGPGEDAEDLLDLDGPPGVGADSTVPGLAVGDRVVALVLDSGGVVVIGRRA